MILSHYFVSSVLMRLQIWLFYFLIGQTVTGCLAAVNLISNHILHVAALPKLKNFTELTMS